MCCSCKNGPSRSGLGIGLYCGKDEKDPVVTNILPVDCDPGILGSCNHGGWRIPVY